MTATLPQEIVEAASLAEASEHLGAHLGLDGPAPEASTRRALDDPLFARALWATRNAPELRDRLLAAPPPARPGPSQGALMRKAAGAVLKWGMEGMKPAAPWVIERRLAACNLCEFQAPAPDTLIYRGAKVAVGRNAKICTSCHCLINTKAAIETERCPERSTETPDLSRWGEPWVDPVDHPRGPW